MATRYTIQCTDAQSGELGCFTYTEKDPVQARFIATSPVFPDLVDLFQWAKDNNIELEHFNARK